MKIINKVPYFAAVLSVLIMICFSSMCFLVENGTNYANAENTQYKRAIFANAENQNYPYIKEKMEFDDSVWGKLATLMQDIIEAWHP